MRQPHSSVGDPVFCSGTIGQERAAILFLARTLTSGHHRSVLIETCGLMSASSSLLCQLESKCRLLILKIDGRQNCE